MLLSAVSLWAPENSTIQKLSVIIIIIITPKSKTLSRVRLSGMDDALDLTGAAHLRSVGNESQQSRGSRDRLSVSDSEGVSTWTGGGLLALAAVIGRWRWLLRHCCSPGLPGLKCRKWSPDVSCCRLCGTPFLSPPLHNIRFSCLWPSTVRTQGHRLKSLNPYLASWF